MARRLILSWSLQADPPRRTFDELAEADVSDADRDIFSGDWISTGSTEIFGFNALRCRAWAKVRLSPDDSDGAQWIIRAAKCLQAARPALCAICRAKTAAA